jgi:hypothetical protein
VNFARYVGGQPEREARADLIPLSKGPAAVSPSDVGGAMAQLLDRLSE